MVEADGKRLAATLAGVEPVLGRALVRYLRLFKPAKTALRMSRAAKLADEVANLAEVGSVSRDDRAGVRRPTTHALWAQGIETMLDQRADLELPMQGHGYLRAVVFSLADKVDAAAERQAEDNARTGRSRAPTISPRDAAAEAAQSYAAMMRDVAGWTDADVKTYVEQHTNPTKSPA
jgi:hypothetical protein